MPLLEDNPNQSIEGDSHHREERTSRLPSSIVKAKTLAGNSDAIISGVLAHWPSDIHGQRLVTPETGRRM